MSENAAFDLVAALGPVLDPAQIVYFEEEATWRILVDETSLLDLVYDPRAEQFVFEVPLGAIADDKQATVHELLLRFSYLWQKNGGVFVALDDEGHAMLMFRSALDQLDVTRLQAVIGNLLDQAFRLRDLINQESPSADEGEDLLTAGAVPV